MVLFWYFLFGWKNGHKTCKNWCVFTVVGRFWWNMFISEGGQNLGFPWFFGFWLPSEINIFWRKRPNMTKIYQFWEVLWTFFSLNKKSQNNTPFKSFLTFSLLSYIEIYIEYRETASGVMWEPLRGSKKFQKIFFVLFGSYRS